MTDFWGIVENVDGVMTVNENKIFRSPRQFRHNGINRPITVFEDSEADQHMIGLYQGDDVHLTPTRYERVSHIVFTFDAQSQRIKGTDVVVSKPQQDINQMIKEAVSDKLNGIRGHLEKKLRSVECPLFPGKEIQLDDASQDNIKSVELIALRVDAGLTTWPQRMTTKGWRSTDNVWNSIPTPAQFHTFSLWASAIVTALRDVAWGHIDNVRALSEAGGADPVGAIEAYEYGGAGSGGGWNSAINQVNQLFS